MSCQLPTAFVPARLQLNQTFSVNPRGDLAVVTADRFGLFNQAQGFAAPSQNLAVKATSVLLHPHLAVVALLGKPLPPAPRPEFPGHRL